MSQTFMSIPLQQPWNDLRIWEIFFNTYRVQTFIELGTGRGGMTLFLAGQCYQRKIYFHTFDNQKFFDFSQGIPALIGLQECFHFVDMFSKDAMEQIREIIDTLPHPLAIFFDNGDKPREWKLYAPLTHPGDFCIVHDWEEEFFSKDLGEVQVEAIMEKLCEDRDYDWRAKWFRRLNG